MHALHTGNIPDRHHHGNAPQSEPPHEQQQAFVAFSAAPHQQPHVHAQAPSASNPAEAAAAAQVGLAQVAQPMQTRHGVQHSKSGGAQDTDEEDGNESEDSLHKQLQTSTDGKEIKRIKRCGLPKTLCSCMDADTSVLSEIAYGGFCCRHMVSCVHFWCQLCKHLNKRAAGTHHHRFVLFEVSWITNFSLLGTGHSMWH